MFDYLSSNYFKSIYPITIMGSRQRQETKILQDIGASVSIVKEGFLRILNHENRQKPCSSALKTSGGNLPEAHCKMWLDVTVNEHSFPHMGEIQ
ncbi:hypothetical protein Smp_164350 [Schistosoma mansoni]|uniref:hypothetical protein n=1 Tax=Schistosoma mansoni TaxID=6183 RepID=UPI0001A62626|nr:hypothetical protein Smp_164350 [Schistosoma mansoni]|eukprot:XP_018653094.1 hypothetical protein Smp_164350 [Schistosoma mansoni]